MQESYIALTRKETVMEDNVCPCMRHKHREEEEYKDLIKRLNRVEGQIRGIKKMDSRRDASIDG